MATDEERIRDIYTDSFINSDDEANTDEAYKKYEKAFDAYSSVYTLITDSFIKFENLKRKIVTKNTISIAIGILGLVIGILGIIIGIIF